MEDKERKKDEKRMREEKEKTIGVYSVVCSRTEATIDIP